MNRRPPNQLPDDIEGTGRPVLFIGGIWDGQFKSFPRNSHVWSAGVDVPNPISTNTNPKDTHDQAVFMVHHYRPEKFVSGQNLRFIFVLQELSPEEILDRLIAGYKEGN